MNPIRLEDGSEFWTQGPFGDNCSSADMHYEHYDPEEMRDEPRPEKENHE
jgi:hypothetical protein